MTNHPTTALPLSPDFCCTLAILISGVAKSGEIGNCGGLGATGKKCGVGILSDIGEEIGRIYLEFSMK